MRGAGRGAAGPGLAFPELPLHGRLLWPADAAGDRDRATGNAAGGGVEDGGPFDPPPLAHRHHIDAVVRVAVVPDEAGLIRGDAVALHVGGAVHVEAESVLVAIAPGGEGDFERPGLGLPGLIDEGFAGEPERGVEAALADRDRAGGGIEFLDEAVPAEFDALRGEAHAAELEQAAALVEGAAVGEVEPDRSVLDPDVRTGPHPAGQRHGIERIDGRGVPGDGGDLRRGDGAGGQRDEDGEDVFHGKWGGWNASGSNALKKGWRSHSTRPHPLQCMEFYDETMDFAGLLRRRRQEAHARRTYG